jgi:hypothetical protein
MAIEQQQEMGMKIKSEIKGGGWGTIIWGN